MDKIDSWVCRRQYCNIIFKLGVITRWKQMRFERSRGYCFSSSKASKRLKYGLYLDKCCFKHQHWKGFIDISEKDNIWVLKDKEFEQNIKNWINNTDKLKIKKNIK